MLLCHALEISLCLLSPVTNWTCWHWFLGAIYMHRMQTINQSMKHYRFHLLYTFSLCFLSSTAIYLSNLISEQSDTAMASSMAITSKANPKTFKTCLVYKAQQWKLPVMQATSTGCHSWPQLAAFSWFIRQTSKVSHRARRNWRKHKHRLPGVGATRPIIGLLASVFHDWRSPN